MTAADGPRVWCRRALRQSRLLWAPVSPNKLLNVLSGFFFVILVTCAAACFSFLS